MADLNYDYENELKNQKEILIDAQDIFNQIFGYKSKSFIAPNNIWSPKLEETLSNLGVEFIKTSRRQILPVGESKKNTFISHFNGQVNKFGQIFLVRNCVFEPSTDLAKDHVKDCISQIAVSFRFKNPAIITSHRLNYIGFIDEENRIKNLEFLNDLLSQIIKRWPDVEFINSDELGQIIKNSKKMI